MKTLTGLHLHHSWVSVTEKKLKKLKKNSLHHLIVDEVPQCLTDKLTIQVSQQKITCAEGQSLRQRHIEEMSDQTSDEIGSHHPEYYCTVL